jgi:hypothetical protein
LLLIAFDFVLDIDETLDNRGEFLMVIELPFPAASVMFYKFTPKQNFLNSCARRPFLASRITKDPHVFAQENVECP